MLVKAPQFEHLVGNEVKVGTFAEFFRIRQPKGVSNRDASSFVDGSASQLNLTSICALLLSFGRSHVWGQYMISAMRMRNSPRGNAAGEASACEIRDKLLEFFSLIELCLFN